MVEEVSATSEENAKIAAIMLSRTTFTETVKIRILSLAYHLEKVFPLYKKELGEKFRVTVLLAEQYLPLKDTLDFYSVPKGGKKWDAYEILDNADMFLKE